MKHDRWNLLHFDDADPSNVLPELSGSKDQNVGVLNHPTHNIEESNRSPEERKLSWVKIGPVRCPYSLGGHRRLVQIS